MKKYINNFFKGHERSVKAKKNILASILIKGISMTVGFLMVRVTLDYLDQTTYGIWLTLTSFLTWFTFFEIGLGSGLKNKLAESLASKDYKKGKIYVSTAYAILSLVVIFLAIAFFIANIFIDWTIVLNTNEVSLQDLTTVAYIVFSFFFFRFVIKLIGIVLFADQRPALSNMLNTLGNLFVLLTIFILTKTTEGSLIYLAWALSAIPVVVLTISTFYFYTHDYKKIAPSIKYVDFKYARGLLNLGIKFFVIQVSGLIIYQSTNFIITQYIGPAEVTVYNIAYKYFSIIMMGFTIIITPFWSAYTEAWAKNDMKWIKSTVKKLLNIWMMLSVAGIIMLIFAKQFYAFWIGTEIQIPFKLSLVLLLYFMTFTFGGVYNMFINGVGKVKLQMYTSVIGAILFIVIAISLAKYTDLGVVGLVLASIISNFNGIIIAPIQYKKIINNKAKGIWNA
ncbi:polysaccharide biosynthesis protein [Aureibaculum marinum]|uniref:Polysaccharide biosynthesis protein n=1 Tax=Aureibaculum marinum TaxID=2487930 RepID=A0A3N4NI41_9FLAO|nr:oligosaccharide flippase family protein [Aureibaculum marinum]RPD94358.1 polysaccharide biosynthesis protein [Aureibaculum marinum]